MRQLIMAAAISIGLVACDSRYADTSSPNANQVAMNNRVAAMTPNQKDQLRAALLQCQYESHAQAANFRGEIIQAAEERNLGDMCMNAALARIEAQPR